MLSHQQGNHACKRNGDRTGSVSANSPFRIRAENCVVVGQVSSANGSNYRGRTAFVYSGPVVPYFTRRGQPSPKCRTFIQRTSIRSKSSRPRSQSTSLVLPPKVAFLRKSRIPNNFGSDSTVAGAVGVFFGQNAAINTIDQAFFEFQCIPCVASSTREFKLT